MKDALSSVEVLNCPGIGHTRGGGSGKLIGRETDEPDFMLAEAWSRS